MSNYILNILKCDKVYYAICSQEWYFLDAKSTKDLILLMIRTRISSYITAGKIFLLTIATFYNVRYLIHDPNLNIT
jgi:hypothetical protein